MRPAVVQGQGSQSELQNQVPAPTQSTTNASVSEVHYLPPQLKSQLISLVVNRCTVNCFMDNYPVLWDSGAQSSIVNDNWRQQCLPHTVVRPISELLEDETLTVFAANDTPIPYIGWKSVSDLTVIRLKVSYKCQY